MTAPSDRSVASPAPVLADLERAHAFLGLAVVQMKHGAGDLREGAAALHHFRVCAARALSEIDKTTAASAVMDRSATAPAGRG